jgi:hypothetical protein
MRPANVKLFWNAEYPGGGNCDGLRTNQVHSETRAMHRCRAFPLLDSVLHDRRRPTVCAPSLREGRLAAKNRVALCSLLMAVTRPNLGAKNELLATVDCYMTRTSGQPRAARRDCQLRVHRYGETIGLILEASSDSPY